MKDYKTENIIILSCSIDMAKSLLMHRKELIARSPIDIPTGWPSYRFRSLLPVYLENKSLQIDTLHLWLAADLPKKRMIGDIILFIDEVDTKQGVLEIRLVDEQDEQIYFRECFLLFIQFVVKHFLDSLETIKMETNTSNQDRIQLLRQVGFKLKKREDPYLVWILDLEELE
ncbi:hypothetical protein [Peribacillus alkalitolerans]|uniref:hypothetical protein n=1 Tax=Peribacillus alkalitolerans TaxID=1550385 RepID=UPI0013D0148D|nr:hypothetical protein [Peribacillus alkalitolerans]